MIQPSCWRAINFLYVMSFINLKKYKFLIQISNRQVSSFHGVYEIMKSEERVLKKKLPTVNGHCCTKCKEYGASSYCFTCLNGHIPKRMLPKSSVLPLWLQEAPRKASSLVFPVARISSSREPLNYSEIFRNLRTSVEQSTE